MNRSSLVLVLALVPFAPAVMAAPTTAPDHAQQGATQPVATGVKALLGCSAMFDKLLSDLQAGKIITAVNSTLIDGEVALAESPKLPLQGGFQGTLSSATLSGETVAIKSHIAAPGGNTSADMSASLEKSGDKVRLRWSYRGKSHSSMVDACTSGYWTASDSSSAIAVKLAAPMTPQVPR